MPSKITDLTLTFGMAQIPFSVFKAEQSDDTGLKTLCVCGGKLGPMADADGNKVACKECGEGYPWYNSAPGKGYELGDEVVPFDTEDVKAAKAETPVDTGGVEKVCAVEDVLLEYAVTGNYYLTPTEADAGQYGALVHALNAEAWAVLSYFRLSGKTRRYAIISRGRVLLALQLADKRPLPGLEYEVDEALEGQATTMLEGQLADDPSLPDVEDAGLKALVREAVGGGDDEDEAEQVALTPEV